VIHICSKCGALLLDDTESCSFCNLPPAENEEAYESVAVGAAHRAESGEPEWRTEVSRRLEQYRARRGRLRPDLPDTQPGLPFKKAAPTRATLDLDDEVRECPPQRPAFRPRQKPPQTERVEIRVQPELDFSSSPYDRARPQTALVPVASLAHRRSACYIDVCFLAFTCAGFVGLFLFASRSAGGELTLGRSEAIVYVAIAYLFYALYFSLFVILAGSTPGLQLRGLSIVRLDGSLPDTRQLLWRVFGYLLSGATLMIGFFWALWDEDHFTWHDRISQTYITAAMPLVDADSYSVPGGRQTFAHK
jgi:uncharacterized RDD family membrane protein YckC